MKIILKEDINYQKNTIVIIGHMGSGKSLVGKKLAEALNWLHFDSDKIIEKNEKKEIIDIFKIKGETYFRKIEEIEIKKLLDIEKAVISLGGGSITIEKIRNLINKKCISIFLKVDIDLLVKRLKNSKKRPLLINANIKNKIVSLNKDRLKYYNNADIIIENSSHHKETVQKILKILNI